VHGKNGNPYRLDRGIDLLLCFLLSTYIGTCLVYSRDLYWIYDFGSCPNLQCRPPFAWLLSARYIIFDRLLRSPVYILLRNDVVMTCWIYYIIIFMNSKIMYAKCTSSLYVHIYYIHHIYINSLSVYTSYIYTLLYRFYDVLVDCTRLHVLNVTAEVRPDVELSHLSTICSQLTATVWNQNGIIRNHRPTHMIT